MLVLSEVHEAEEVSCQLNSFFLHCRLQIAQGGVYCGVQLCRSLQHLLIARELCRKVNFKVDTSQGSLRKFYPFFSQNLDFLAKVVHAISAEELRMTMNIGTFCPQSAEGPGYSAI